MKITNRIFPLIYFFYGSCNSCLWLVITAFVMTLQKMNSPLSAWTVFFVVYVLLPSTGYASKTSSLVSDSFILENNFHYIPNISLYLPYLTLDVLVLIKFGCSRDVINILFIYYKKEANFLIWQWTYGKDVHSTWSEVTCNFHYVAHLISHPVLYSHTDCNRKLVRRFVICFMYINVTSLHKLSIHLETPRYPSVYWKYLSM